LAFRLGPHSAEAAPSAASPWDTPRDQRAGEPDPLAKIGNVEGVFEHHTGEITREQLQTIAETKMPDLNANDVEAAMKVIAGTARSMGVTVAE
jgi:ribosomal protein L11